MITMAITEINALRESLLRFVSLIQELGDSYFAADAALAEFPLRVELLKARHEILEAHFERYGLRHSPSFLEAVKEAQKLLNKEVAKLEGEAERACCPIGQICRPVSGMLFSKSVGLHLRIVQDAYASILEHLRTESQLHDMGSQSVLRRSFSLPFRKDGHYVPLKRSEEKIYSALEAAPAVVLLYGGPGKGKSTLARQVSLSYKERKSTFAQVVMLECGPKVDVAAKMTDLLQKLGCEFSERSQTLRDDFKVVKLLQNYLKKQKLLIVLDDLWERELIQELYNLSGPGVKFLITSQVAHLCDGFHSGDKTCVLMEDLEHEDSRRILATHAGFEDQDIPPHLQEVEDKIIAQAEANPLAMATLGARIAVAGKEKLEVWDSVSDDLLELLDERTAVNVHGIGYPRSFWATMQISIGALSHKQKELLVLMSMCRSPSVSKSAIQILYSTAISHERCKTLDFLLLCSELKSRHLLTEQNTELLAIHSLTKGFILEQMKDTVKHVTTLLNKPNFVEKGKVSTSRNRPSLTNVLVYLYIDAEYSREAKMQIDPPSNLYISDETQSRRASLKRYISEVLIELLVLEARPSNKWTEELSMCANQVLLEFVCNDHFCDDKISKLLDSPTAMVSMLTFLINVNHLDESYWENIIQSTSGILQSLLKILQDNSLPIHQAQAALILAFFSSHHKENPKNIASVSGMLPQLVLSLSQAQNPNLQRFAATILVDMANVEKCGSSTADILISYPGLVDIMVKFLDEESTAGLQGISIVMLNNLTGTDTHNGNLARWPGLVEGMAKALLADNYHVHHGFAAATIAQLADTNEEATLPKLLKYPRLVDNLVKFASEEQNSSLLMHFMFLIDKLVNYCERSSTFHKIIDWCGPLEGLAEWILRAQNPSVQGRIALTLANITRVRCAKANNTIVGDMLFTYPGVLELLIKSLQEDSNTNLQQGAALLFANLAKDSNKHKLVMSLGLLEGLAKSLARSDNLLQMCAAMAISNMAGTGEKMIHDKLLDQSGLVDHLVQSLHKNQNSDVQKVSLAALCNLTVTSSNILAGWPGFLSGLEKLLIMSDNPSLQANAAATIANIASMHGTRTSDKIINHSGLMDKLVKSLYEDQNLGLQQHSAMALCRLISYSLENNVHSNLLEGLQSHWSKVKTLIFKGELP